MLFLLLGCGDPVAVVDYLSVVNVAPSHGAANISPDTDATVTFNDDLVDGSWVDRVQLLPDGGNEGVPSTLEYDPLTRTLSLVPREALDAGSTYVLTVTAGVEGTRYGDLPAPIQSRFTTAPAGGAGVTNNPPVAILAEAVCPTLGETIELDGSASYDPDGDDVTLEFRLVAGPDEGALDGALFTPTEYGEYLVGLVADDGQIRSTEAFGWILCEGDTGAP